MNGDTAASTDGSLYPNWLPTGVWQVLFSGKYNDELYHQGYGGDYWSSTAIDTDGAFDLYFDSIGVGPDYGNDKRVGLAVRCTI